MQSRDILNTGVKGRLQGRRFKAWVVGIGLFLALTYVPLTRAMDLGPMYTRGPEGGWSVRNQDLRHWRGLRWDWSHNSTWGLGQSSWSHSALKSFPTPYPARRIWVVCQTPGEAVHAMGEELVKELLENADIVEVAFFPFVQLPITEFRPPDLWVTLDQVHDVSKALPGYFSAKGSVVATVTPRLLDTLTVDKSDIEAPLFATLLAYQDSRLGLISAAGRWDKIGKRLANKSRLLHALKELRGEASEPSAALTIDLLHGPIRCEPIQALAALGREVQQIKEGPAWMVHDLSAWSVQPGPSRASRLEVLRSALLAEGWELESDSLHGFHMKLGQRELSVGPQIHAYWFRDEWSTEIDPEQIPIGVQHFHPFSAEECLTYLDQRLSHSLSPAQLHALLAQLSPKRRQALVDLLFKPGDDGDLDPSHLYQIATQLSEPRLKQQ